MRLDKFLGATGFGSRRDIKEIIKKGRVSVNGKAVFDPSVHIDPRADEVLVDGKAANYREFVYLMLNKPSGVVSATDDNLHKTVLDLIPKEYRHFKLFPCGRLDIDTEGLLLLTNDGQTAHKLLSPSKKVDKKYYVKVKGSLTQEDVKSFNEGILINGGYTTKPANLEIIKSGEISEAFVTLREEKFHQVKRMFQALSKQVVYLKRVEFAGLKLDESLSPGEFRELRDDEINRILSYGQ